MTKAEALDVRVGDLLIVKPTWNEFCGPENRVESPAEVLRITQKRTSSEIAFHVMTVSAEEWMFDCAWFDGKA